MTVRFSPAQILKDLRNGPSAHPPPSARQVAVAAEKYPTQFAGAMHALFYTMTDAVMRHPGRNLLTKYTAFSRPWREAVQTDETAYYFGSLDAYRCANYSGFRELSWETTDKAYHAAQELSGAMPDPRTVEGLAWRALLGQVQSIYSRADAAETFRTVRLHRHSTLVKDFYRDNGALTYYSEGEINSRRRTVPTLTEMTTQRLGPSPSSAQALLVSIDPSFFRIYAPMILHNAQQVPSLDVVIVLCAPPDQVEKLWRDAEKYLAGLTALNRQEPPRNVRIIAVETPEWVRDDRTFYACARFLVMPGILDEYANIYATDADMFLTKDPRPFLRNIAEMPSRRLERKARSAYPLGVVTWQEVSQQTAPTFPRKSGHA